MTQKLQKKTVLDIMLVILANDIITGYGGRQNAPVDGNEILLMSDKLLDHIMYLNSDNQSDAPNTLQWANSGLWA